MVRMTRWMGMLLLACMTTGCAQQLFDCIDTTCYQIKCDHRAKSAWMEVRDLYGGVAFPFNFGEGFRDGYRAVCLGNDTGCAPPMPPRRYWSSCYLNCEGKARAVAWYDGYAHGVVAASCSGCSSNQMVTGVANGSGEVGSALKGYKPPIPHPYLNHMKPDGYDPQGLDGLGPGGFGPEPTPLLPRPNQPRVPSRGDELQEDLFPGDRPGAEDEAIPEFAPQPPAVFRGGDVPHLPAAEVYRVPVF